MDAAVAAVIHCRAVEKVSLASDMSKISLNVGCCFRRDLWFPEERYNLAQVVGQIHEIDSESTTNTYLRKRLNRKMVWSL